MAHDDINAEAGGNNPRSAKSNNRTDASSREQSKHSQAGLAQEFHQAVAIGNALLDSLKSYSRLVGLEANLALRSIPALVGSWLLLLPAILLLWVTLSLLLAWLAYSLSAVAWLGFVVLFVLQVVLVGALWLSVRRYRRRLLLPESRRHLQSFLQELSDGFDTKSSSSEPAVDPSKRGAD
jgi:type IV secretory pathway TrbL component